MKSIQELEALTRPEIVEEIERLKGQLCDLQNQKRQRIGQVLWVQAEIAREEDD